MTGSDLTKDWRVLAWMMEQRRKGRGDKRILATANAGIDGWPLPGVPLSEIELAQLHRRLDG